MAMRVAQTPHFWAEVTFPMIADCGDNGEQQYPDISFRVKYRRLEEDEYKQLMERVNASRTETLRKLTEPLFKSTAPLLIGSEGFDAIVDAQPSGPKPITDREIIDQVMVGWDHVLDDNDAPLAFNPDNLPRVLKSFGCGGAIVKRFLELHEKAAEKNFARQSVTSQASKA